MKSSNFRGILQISKRYVHFSGSSLGEALEKLSGKLDVKEWAQPYVELLRLPLAVGKVRKSLLSGLEKMTGKKFNGDIWQFVTWATESESGKALNLRLSGSAGQ